MSDLEIGMFIAFGLIVLGIIDLYFKQT